MLDKIISGGQTGADRGGLEGAKECGIKTGGTAPHKYKTEKGLDESLKEFGLTDCAVSNYTYRTELNVKDSDGTVVFMNVESPGSEQTIEYCEKYKKPFLVNPEDPAELAEWLATHNITVLNVAGNRESKVVGICEYVKRFIIDTINLLREGA